jgi:hypothetical protein
VKGRVKRSKQLIAECSAVVVILALLASGGAFESLNIPTPWASIQNPSLVQQQQGNLTALAQFYNITLTYLAQTNYSGVELNLQSFNFINIQGTLSSTANSANSEIGSMNVSVPIAISDFLNASYYIGLGEYGNASLKIGAGCQEALAANTSLTQFANSTTPQFAGLKVPVKIYAIGEDSVNFTITQLVAKCNTLKAQLAAYYSPPGNGFLISSPQSEIITGGNVVIFGNLSQGSKVFSGQEIRFYFNGTYIGSTYTNKLGELDVTLAIPFVYESVGEIWGSAPNNATSGLLSTSSNALFFTIVYNGTQIILRDPPAYLPTETFSVNGNLSTLSGTVLPSAPVTVKFLNESLMVTTNSKGDFFASFTVPANASNGVYLVTARFSPSGLYGPSFNVTTVNVYHEIIKLTLDRPDISFAGFDSSIQGRVETTNGTIVRGASVTLFLPWGSYPVTTNSSGWFEISLPIPIWEFAFSSNASVSVLPSQPYISASLTTTSLDLFNFLWIVIPSIVVGTAGYEINSFVKREKKTQSEKIETEMLQAGTTPAIIEEIPIDGSASNKIVSIYREALELLLSRFHIEINRSSTIREILHSVQRLDLPLTDSFADISHAVEEYLYGLREPDTATLAEADENLSRLKETFEEGE